MLVDDRYCKVFNFSRVASENTLKIKAENTIVEKWPLALKLKQGDVGFDEEFTTLFASGHPSTETYVEWARAE